MRGGVRYWGNGISSMNDIFMICWSLLIYLVFSSRAFRVVIFLTIANVYPTSKKWLFGPPEKKAAVPVVVDSITIFAGESASRIPAGEKSRKIGCWSPRFGQQTHFWGWNYGFLWVCVTSSPGLTRPQPGLSGLRQNTPWHEIPKMLWKDGPVWREYFGEPSCWDISKSFQVNLDPYRSL